MSKIFLNIEADGPNDLTATIVALAAVMGVATVASSATPDPKPSTTAGKSRSTKAATSSDQQSSVAGDATGNAADTAGAGTASAQTNSGTVTREQLERKCLAFSAKAGPTALKELFVQHGSAEGKFSKVPESSFTELNAALDAALAA